MLENIRISFQSIWAHKLRSILTMLGVIIGIAAIIAIFAIIEGQSEAMKSSLIGMGNNTISVVYQEPERHGEEGYWFDNTSYQSAPPIKEEAIEAILSEPHVNGMSVYHQSWSGEVYHLMNSSYPEMYGVDHRYLELFPTTMLSGRSFSTDDYETYSQVVLINEELQNELFPDGDVLHKIIDVSGHPFRVIGVFSESPEDGEAFWGYWSQPKMYVTKNVWPLLNGFDAPMQVAVQADSSNTIQEVGLMAASVLNADLPPFETAQYEVADFERMAEELEEYNRVFAFILGGIASISLLVGGIGVMNIMLVSVTERTREIGIKKALGAKRHVVLTQFLTEAVVLTSLGGIFGILLGVGVAKIISTLSGMPLFISIPAVLGSLIFSMAVGIVFGLLPSIKASKLQPVEALRYE